MRLMEFLDHLASIKGSLAQLADAHPSIRNLNAYESAQISLARCIEHVIEEKNGYMTPEQNQAFQRNLRDLREGGC